MLKRVAFLSTKVPTADHVWSKRVVPVRLLVLHGSGDSFEVRTEGPCGD